MDRRSRASSRRRPLGAPASAFPSRLRRQRCIRFSEHGVRGLRKGMLHVTTALAPRVDAHGIRKVGSAKWKEAPLFGRRLPMPEWKYIPSGGGPPYPPNVSGGWDAPIGQYTAVCLVGELRSFSMPVVHTSLISWLKDLHADTFVYAHTRKSASNPYGVRSCAVNLTALALLDPIMVVRAQPVPTCSPVANAVAQFHHVGSCFVFAATYTVLYAKRPYDIFIRARPDMVIAQPSLPPWEFLSSRVAYPLVSLPNSDMVFAMTQIGLKRFLNSGMHYFKACQTHLLGLESIDFLTGRVGNPRRDAKLIPRRQVWNLTFAIARAPGVFTHAHPGGSIGAGFVKATLQRIRLDPALGRCHVT